MSYLKIQPLGLKTLVLFFTVLVPASLTAMVMESSRGDWPKSWPKELEAFRAQARTVRIANGTQEYVYIITFTDRAEFERIWPVIAQLKTPSAPLTLYSTNSPKKAAFWNNEKASVRIFAPSRGGVLYPSALVPDEKGREKTNELLKVGKLKTLRAEPPWPAEIVSADGGLPEFVVANEEDGIMKWVPVGMGPAGFQHRARVDLELVVDGKIIDLNSIPIPANTPVHDERFKK
jgi:hypothetical protein